MAAPPKPGQGGQANSPGDGLGDFLRTETTGGVLLVIATAVALVWANSPWSGSYESLRQTVVGPAALHLDLTLQTWAQDGLLAVFFFVAGLELKRELVLGELRTLRTAMLPLCSALGGMVVPALVFLAVANGAEGADRAWSVPVATDIAFALGVLALAGSQLPASVRVFLLALAVVDDLGAIMLIALLFTSDIEPAWLGLAVALLIAYAWLQRRRVRSALLYVPLAMTCWTALHASGVHATLAGVALGLLTRARRDPDETRSPTERLEHRIQPFSATVCVPVFALFAAGLVIDSSTVRAAASDRIAIGVALGLIIGKPLGVVGGAMLARLIRVAALPPDLLWRDLAAVAVLAGVGFTVSLLLAELSFPDDLAAADRTKMAVLFASALMGVAGALVLRLHIRYRVAPKLDEEAT